MAESSSAVAEAVDADDVGRSARRVPPRRRRSRPRRPPPPPGRARAARAASRKVSGAGLPCSPSSLATTPSTRASKRSSIPAATRISRQLALDETTARRSPASRERVDVAHRALVHLDPLLVEHRAAPGRSCGCQPVDRLRLGRVAGVALGELDAARAQEGAHPVLAGHAVDVLVVVGLLEGDEGLAGAPRTLPQVGVEHLLPGGEVDRRRPGEDPVEVEEARPHRRRKSEHHGFLRHRDRPNVHDASTDANVPITGGRPMQLGMIGLGRMGANLVRRLMRAGHECVVFDVNPEAVRLLEQEGAIGAASLDEFVARLTPPRAAWIMVPAALTGRTVEDLAGRMDGGGHDHRRRQLVLPRRHPPRRGARRAGPPLRRRRHQRRHLRARARLLPDDRRRHRGGHTGSTRSSGRSRPGSTPRRVPPDERASPAPRRTATSTAARPARGTS